MSSALQVLQLCRANTLKLTTVESCTGGMIAAAITDIAGSSDVFECGFITYSNQAKTMLVGVPAALITTYGAVSQEVALAMALGGIRHSRSDIAVAVTGIAGPGGASVEKPIGLVHIAVADRFHSPSHYEARFGEKSRNEIRLATINQAFKMVVHHITVNQIIKRN